MPHDVGTKPLCPICSAASRYFLPAPNWGEMRRCVSCGFVFANPLTLPEGSENLFGRAYEGGETRTSMHQFHNRILYQELLTKAGITETKWGFNSAQGETIAFLQEKFAPGSAILDIGCGTGKFLDAVQRLGFEAYGLDISKELVELLQNRGLRIWHGTIDTLPSGWVAPQVCTSFGVMHHLPDPVGFLETIRAKFPNAMLIVSEVNRFNGIHPYSKGAVPPRHLSWWGPEQLELAMKKVGYDVQVVLPKVLSSDWILEDMEFRLVSALSPRFPYLIRAYYKISGWVFWPLALFYRLRGWSNQILAIGQPR